MEKLENEVQVAKAEIQPIKETLGNVQIIQNVLAEVMKMGCHYDKISGCGDKPMLLKAGAEKILSTFRIGVEAIIEDLGDDYERRYRITCRGFYIPTGNTVGYGVGEGSTSEKKYAWRKAVCDEEYDNTEETKRQIAWVKEYVDRKPTGKHAGLKQVRQNPADIANTVLKMAKKRAMVDLCLTATACSDIFDQDLDEEHIRESVQSGSAKTYQKPKAQQAPAQSNQDPGNFCSEKQSKRMFAIVMSASKDIEDRQPYSKSWIDGWLETVYQITRYDETPSRLYEEICNHIENKTIPAPGA